MFLRIGVVGGILLCTSLLSAGEPAVTVYNQNFAVVRDTVPLDLKEGVNQMRFCDTTMHLEPTSVILRDPTAQHALQIWEQNFRADPVSQELLLSLYEGQTIDFQQTIQDGTIKDGNITFKTIQNFNGNESVTTYNAKIEDGALKGKSETVMSRSFEGKRSS